VAIALQDSLGDTERAGALFAKAQSLSTSVNDYDARKSKSFDFQN
jgi:hypothetical protein